MSPGHIYHYFKNKEAIVEAIVELDKQRVLEHIEDLKGQPNILDALVAGLEQRLTECAADCAAFLLEICAEATRNEIVGDLMRDRCVTLERHLQEALVIGQRQGSIAADIDLKSITALVAAMLSGLDMRMALRPETDRASMGVVQEQFLRRMLAPVHRDG
jgi:AcrR family transcriptional regulator